MTEENRALMARVRTLTSPDEIVALATRHGHGGVGVGHYCEFYIAPANRLVTAGCPSAGRAIMQAGMDNRHVTWLQMAAWEDFVKYTESEANKMKPEDVVMIYCNPATEKQPEGKAKLIREYRPDTGDGLSIWYVEFLNEPGAEYLRAIKEEAAR